MDKDVSVDIELPSIPRQGDTIFLSDELFDELVNKAKSNLEIARRYAPNWFYSGSSGCIHPKEENLEDLGFDDAMLVSCVAFIPGDEFVHIEIDK